MDIVTIINKYGFPIFAAAGMAYLIYYVWKWATSDIKPVLSKTHDTLINLIDRIRLLENDLIRVVAKLKTYVEIKGNKN